MKKMDKKGFTLIELLAVIVILAIIMVIAVPQILNVIENSRASAWKSNVKMIAEGIELGKATSDFSTDKFNINDVCTGASGIEGTNLLDNESFLKIADVSSADTKVTCTSTKGGVKVEGQGQFDGQKTATLACSTGSCKVTYAK